MQGYEIKLFLLKAMPFILLATSVPAFIYGYSAGRYKDRNKQIRREIREEKQRAQPILPYQGKAIRKLLWTAAALPFSIFIYLYLSRIASVWYLKAEVLLISALIPYAAYSLFAGRKRDKYAASLPEFFQHLIDALRYQNNLINAFNDCKNSLTDARLRKDLEMLAGHFEENKIEKGLRAFYNASGKSPFIYQFITLLEFYTKKGGDITEQIKRLKSNVTRYLRVRQTRKSALMTAKIIGAACIFAVPWGTKFTSRMTMGYAADYYASAAGQNLLAFTLFYVIISLSFIFIIERV